MLVEPAVYNVVYHVYMRTVIDVDDDLLDEAAKELGTKTKKDTVNEALRFVAARRQRAQRLFDNPLSLGIGEDADDPEVMGQARR